MFVSGRKEENSSVFRKQHFVSDAGSDQRRYVSFFTLAFV
jgi:hypothetical protein